MNTASGAGSSRPNGHDCLICVDMGTTNTRVWLVAEKKIIARESTSVGVRDSARTGNTGLIERTLQELIEALQAKVKPPAPKPTLILGAGMITSALGLLEIDHVPAPAGEHELAHAICKFSRPKVTELPIWLAPGVRTGPLHPETKDLPEMDVIRGEETLCVGLQQLGMLGPRSTLLNLGSHWKAITLDDAGRIASSFTTLSGELIHAVQQHTVLSSALPQERFSELDLHWLEQGQEQEELSGLSRALFCVRILEQKFKLTPLQRASFLLGAVVSCDLTAALENHRLGKAIVITGSGAAVEAWKHFLQGEDLTVEVCDPDTVETAFIAGLLRLVELVA